MSTQWYYIQNGHQFGPVPTEHLRNMLSTGVLGSSDLVWSEGLSTWMPGDQVVALVSAHATNPPSPMPPSIPTMAPDDPAPAIAQAHPLPGLLQQPQLEEALSLALPLGPRRSRKAFWAAIGVTTILLLVGGYWFSTRGGPSIHSPNQAPTSTFATAPSSLNIEGVYVAGWESNGAHKVAKYWKNGIPVVLSDGALDTEARAILVVGSDVYVAGTENTGTQEPAAIYWKNGVKVVLPNGATPTEAICIAVSGSDVYVAGEQFSKSKIRPGSIRNALYWKNGIPVYLTTDSNYDTFVESIIVAGPDVYVAATARDENFRGIAKYWKNGVVVELFDGSYSSSVYSMAISGNDLYLGGSTLKDQGKHNQAIYWKNGNAVILTDGKLSGQVDSLAISENNIYALGKETDINNGIIIQKLWKNGKLNSVSSNSLFEFTSLAVSNNTVYISGVEQVGNNRKAKYWINILYKFVDLTDGTHEAAANSIFVTPGYKNKSIEEPQVSGASANGNLSEMLSKTTYRASWDALFVGEANVDDWLANFSVTQEGTVSPGEIVQLDGSPYQLNTVLKRHDSGGGTFVVLFSPSGAKAWGLLLKLPKEERFFGNPDEAKKKVLRGVFPE